MYIQQKEIEDYLLETIGFCEFAALQYVHEMCEIVSMLVEETAKDVKAGIDMIASKLDSRFVIL